MNPIVRDCFTADCLKKAGKSTGAAAGIRVKFSGEAQIYDWSIEIYDLGTGSKLAARKGACELCGRSEVARTYRSTLSGVLNEATPRSRPAVTKTEPTKTVTPDAPRQVETPATSARIKIVQVAIDVEPPSAVIIFGESEVGRGKTTLELSPGEHQLTFKADGYRTIKELVVIDDSPTNANMKLRVHLPKKDAPPEAVHFASDGPIDRMGSDRLVYGIVGVSSGLVFLGMGAWLAAIDGDLACNDSDAADCPEVYSTGGAAFVSTLTGATLLTAGGVLLAWEALAGESTDTVKVAPAVNGDAAGLMVFGRF